MKKKYLKNEDLKKYQFYDEECGRLHRLIRQETDKARVLEYFELLIKYYDKMSSMVKPSWMERIAIRQLVRTRDALRKSKHATRPRPAPSDKELEEAVSSKETLKKYVNEKELDPRGL